VQAHPSVQVWHTDNATHTFAHLGGVPVRAGGVVTLTVNPESVYTITSTTGQSRGTFPTPPAASSAFPTIYEDDFEVGVVESLPKYWADQCGSFQIMPSGGGRTGHSIQQRVPLRPGVNRWAHNLQNPLTILGDPNASAPTRLSVDVRVPPEAFTAAAPTPPSLAAALPSAAATSRMAPTYKYTAGRIQNGRGDWGIAKTLTLAEAEALCAQTQRCEAITLASKIPRPTRAQQIWLTSKRTVEHGSAGAGWQSFLLTPPHPAPPPPPPPIDAPSGVWVGLCGRVSQVGQSAAPGGTSAGVCLQLNASSSADGAATSWRIEQNGKVVLAHGTLDGGGPSLITAWHTLELAFGCDSGGGDGGVGGGGSSTLSATIDGKVVASGINVSATVGMAALATGWHVGEFDRFKLAGCSR
jgi:hypothetical protein